MPVRGPADVPPVDEDDWCRDCGVNPSTWGERCSLCQGDEDFMNCRFCHGSSCTRECEDDEDLT